MSKEEILEKHSVITPHQHEELYYKSEVLPAMQEYTDQEKEKVAVAFAEWKENKTYVVNGNFVYLTSEWAVSFYNNSDLYQYFIENIYNK